MRSGLLSCKISADLCCLPVIEGSQHEQAGRDGSRRPAPYTVSGRGNSRHASPAPEIHCIVLLMTGLLSMQSSGGGLLLSPRSGSGRQQQARGGSLPPSSSEVRDGAAFEQEVAQLMESDMTTAMQYLQSKGLCLMPVALASAISGQKGASSAAVQPENGGAKEMLRAVKPLASPIHGR